MPDHVWDFWSVLVETSSALVENIIGETACRHRSPLSSDQSRLSDAKARERHAPRHPLLRKPRLFQDRRRTLFKFHRLYLVATHALIDLNELGDRRLAFEMPRINSPRRDLRPNR